mmetsp:Transcript_15480/g.33683  ORF Transcript_15480/g.33683 Transcript_15480/m.33683 type:complete len:82 (-) Transcript_15480:657-902(-)
MYLLSLLVPSSIGRNCLQNPAKLPAGAPRSLKIKLLDQRLNSVTLLTVFGIRVGVFDLVKHSINARFALLHSLVLAQNAVG